MTAAVLFAALAALHVYWGRGGRWPGHDEASLASMVSGESGTMPGRAACFAVAGMLASSSLLVLSAAGIIVALPLAHQGCWVIVVVLGVRGGLGFFDRFLRPTTRGTRFERLNLAIYSPLCSILAGLTYVSALRA
jgi:hypothetical protein